MKRTLNSYLKSKHVNQENGYEDDYYEGSNLSLQDPRKSYMGGQNRERNNGDDTSCDMKNFDDLFGSLSWYFLNVLGCSWYFLECSWYFLEHSWSFLKYLEVS